ELGLAPPASSSSATVKIGSADALPLFYLDATEQTPRTTLPLPLGTSLRLSNRHLEYALTWYSFAATLLIIFGLFARGRLKQAS
ncbi:MAG: hypothetical protein RL291_18, partial [Pseudomonadota bacterium]